MKSNTYKVIDRLIPEGKLSDRFVVSLSLALLFLISGSYFYWFGNSIFLYQENNSLFIFSFEYFHKFFVRPGGLLVYASNFLTQFYFNSLYGTLILSTIFIMFFIGLLEIFRRLSLNRSFSLLLILLPVCSLLLLHTRYDLSIMHSLGYLLVVLCFLLSIVLTKRNIRFVILCFFPIFFYLVGSFALIYLGMYLVFSVIYEKGRFRYLYPAILIVIAFVTFILFKEVIFFQPDYYLLGFPLFFNETNLTKLLSLLGAFIILYPLLIKISGSVILTKKSGIITFATMLTLFTLTVYGLFKRYDPLTSGLLQLEKSVYNQDWDSVINQQEQSPIRNKVGQFYYNLAISEKNQLCDRLFFIEQNFGPESLALPHDSEQDFRSVYFYYGIGLITEAHHLAYELMVQHGYCPENIKMLIKTELISGNYKIAERYLNILKKTFHYRSWAEKYEKMLFEPDLVKSDTELGEKINMLPKRDFFILPDDTKNIEFLLRGNPYNKRVFEYKMARLLLEKDLLTVISEVKKMKEIGYVKFPNHIEEAIVAYFNLSKKVPDLGGLSINRDTEQRFIRYTKIFMSCKGNKSLMEKVLKKDEKNTFWYYLQF